MGLVSSFLSNGESYQPEHDGKAHHSIVLVVSSGLCYDTLHHFVYKVRGIPGAERRAAAKYLQSRY
jgi:hypothetical protein